MSDKAYALEARLNALMARIGPWPADIGPITDVTTTGLKTLSSSPQTIPAGVIAGTEKYDIDAAGVFTTGNPAPTAMTFSVYYGNISTGTDIGDMALPAAGLPVSLAGAPWRLHADVTWMSATGAECMIVLNWRTAGGVGNSAVYHQKTFTSGLDTTTGKFLTLAFAFTGTGVTLTTRWCLMARRA